MAVYITEPGNYYSKYISGESPEKMQDDVALVVDTDGEVLFDTLELYKCGVPLVHKNGKLKIKRLLAYDFTADLLNSWGNLEIDELVVYYNNPDFLYSDKYHVDALGQFFGSNVTIKKITARIKGSKVQGMMLSEPILYENFFIGENGVDIQIEYPFVFVANTLRNSALNFGDHNIKIKKVKDSEYHSANIFIENSKGIIKYNSGDVIV